MIDKNLISYIEQNLRNGYSASSIQNALINQGYPAQNVLDTINYVQGNNQNTPKTATQSQSSSKKALFILIPVILIIIIGLSVFFFISFSPKSISEEDFSQGTNFELKESKEVKFNLDEEVHTIKVDSVSDNSVSLTIQSNPIKVDLNIGEEKKFDLDNDGFYDIKIKLNNIIDGIPDLYVKKIHESTCLENWNCGSWSDCTEQGRQSRTCTDTNSCGTTKNKPSTSQSCTYVEEKTIINPNDITLDIILPKNSYEVDEEVSGDYYLRYQGEPFKGAVIYCDHSGCSKTTGMLDDIDFNNPDKTNALKVALTDTFYSADTYDYSIYIYDCQDIDDEFNTDDCGKGGWPPTIDIEDIVSSVTPLKSKSKTITVTGVNEEYTPECTNNDDCTQTCTHCDDGTYVCAYSSNPLINQKCVECITDFSCVDGYACENNVCVEEEEEPEPEPETYPVTDPDTIMDCYSEDLSEILCSPEKALEFTETFETRLGSCEISEGTFALGFEPFMGIFRGYEIQDEQNGNCVVKFWFLENSVIDSSLINKDMICEYDSSKRTAQGVNDCFEECCSGELVDALNAIQS
tara:strand:+ start:198 stop:1925 length:1728 start_codon:yes stop_codon:yes gene_type:complete